MDGKEILHGIRIGRHDFHPEERIYLLNTDFDCKIFATVDNGVQKREFVLLPGELKSISYF